ncbi:MAG: Zn-ribbon domain-containing OB-fold protein [Myxococcota bacterium]|nr:DNA-binding protein [Spirochaeta sp.]RPG14033.1 MAG: DNA-binding protein [Proteobacteria bacterium TMED72]
MSEPETILSTEGLFAETSAGPRLLGSRCLCCGTAYFPRSEYCRNPECPEPEIQDAEFGPRGRLWSVTTQGYQPPAPVVTPDPYTPYAVGFIDLHDHPLRVVGRLQTDSPEDVEVGCEVELILAPLGQDGEGRDVISWQFKPVETA